MAEEINIGNFLELVRKNKNTVIAIIAFSFISSVVYSMIATKYYKANAYIMPAEPKHIRALNIVGGDGILLTQTKFELDDVYTRFILNVQSRKYQRKFFFENELYKHFKETNYDKSFEENFYDNLSFTLKSGTMSREFRRQQFLTATLIHTDPKLAAEWLNQYIKMVRGRTAIELADAANTAIINKRNILKGEVLSRQKLAKRTTEDRIVQLEEALQIANKLGIVEREENLASTQSISFDKDTPLTHGNPLYLMGTKALNAEINTLKNRTSQESFITGLRSLQHKVESLTSIIVDPNDVQVAQIDQFAVPPTVRFSPKRKLIVFLGTSSGVAVAFLYLLFFSAFRREQ